MLPDSTAWTHSASGTDAAAVVLKQPIRTTKVVATLGARAEMEVLFFEIRGCQFLRKLVTTATTKKATPAAATTNATAAATQQMPQQQQHNNKCNSSNNSNKKIVTNFFFSLSQPLPSTLPPGSATTCWTGSCSRSRPPPPPAPSAPARMPRTTAPPRPAAGWPRWTRRRREPRWRRPPRPGRSPSLCWSGCDGATRTTYGSFPTGNVSDSTLTGKTGIPT